MPSYVVRNGDSLFLIARRFGTTPEALAQANGIRDPQRLLPGLTLQVPGWTGKSSFESAAETAYTVQPGDSLYLIGRRHGLTAEALAAANGLSTSTPLLPGQQLRIPAPNGGDGGSPQATRYIIQPGDSLFLIGKRHGLSAEALAAANGISTRVQLHPGQVLMIPAAPRPPANTPGPVTTPPPVTGPAEGDTSFRALWPMLQQYAAKYGADPKAVAGIIAQESTWVNHQVHRDGTGHGLIGLDDHGMLPAFEKWSKFKVGRGRSARIIPPALQVEFLAKTIGEMTENHRGNTWAAVREWHRGLGPGMWDSKGNTYERLIRGQISKLF